MCARNGAEHVLAIEPSPDNLTALREHVAANPALGRRIEIMHAAISDTDGEIEFIVNDSDGAVGQIRADGVAQYEDSISVSHIRVPSWTLDSLLPRRTSPPVLVKIDVEGAEGLVLRAPPAAREYRPAIVMEVHNASARLATIDLLTRAGLSVVADRPGRKSGAGSAGPRDRARARTCRSVARIVRRVLMLSPHFPPDSSAGTHRVRLLAPHLPEYGWQPIVVAVPPDRYEGLLTPVCCRLFLPVCGWFVVEPGRRAGLVPSALAISDCGRWRRRFTRASG